MKLISTSLLLCLLAACSAGGLSSHSAGVGTLRGRAVDRGGAPVAGVRVVLIQDDASRVQTSTAADGSFSLSQVASGSALLALNDGHGAGLVRRLSVYAAGATDAGDLTVDDLAGFPEAVTLRGLGFEERVTDGTGDLSGIVYSGDRTVAYGFRGSSTSPGKLVRIDLAQGTEEVLPGGPALGVPQSQLQLFDDRYLVWTRRPLLPDIAVYDLKTHLLRTFYGEAFDAALGEVVKLQDPFVAADALFLLRAEPAPALNGASRSRFALVRVDLASGAEKAVYLYPPGPDGLPEATNPLPFFLKAHDGQRYLSARYGECAAGPGQCVPAETPNLGLQLFVIDLHTLTSRKAAQLDDYLPGGIFAGASGSAIESGGLYLDSGAGTVYALTQAASSTALAGIDLASGNRTEVRRLGGLGTDNFFGQLAFTGPGASLFSIIGHAALDNTTSWTVQREGVPDGRPLDLPLRHSVGGLDLAFCQRPYVGNAVPTPNPVDFCVIRGMPGGQIEISGRLTQRDNALVGVTLSNQGAVLRRRLVPAGVFYGAVPYEDAFGVVKPSPDGRHEAALSFDARTAAIQILLDTLDHVDSQLSRVTYLRADHLAPAWSADGRFLYSLTRDPLTGFLQLFRLDVG